MRKNCLCPKTQHQMVGFELLHQKSGVSEAPEQFGNRWKSGFVVTPCPCAAPWEQGGGLLSQAGLDPAWGHG